ncbi:FUSC family protein [Chitinophaga nivalis]|uniref:FUSC family protein n=1 Tax=Chitinophaga nivalis TaxID=2991709 RepID=A0ABT3IL09_9BACT|nr:FUSC family protein [Chitinophaga nivalis]MCW3465662.1 FUSC family protein [Chitinophaga nivalis]MCW3484647.1 FUSC family protein [Chitinophaga nivalis]
MIDQQRTKRLLIYAAKCVSGVLAVMGLSWLLNYQDVIWVLISVMLVLSPDGSDAVTLAVTRIKANAVGAASGFLLLLIHPNMIFMMCIAVMITVVLCNILYLEPATRTALAATIIVMTHEAGEHLWDTAVARVLSVLAGCLLGLLITFIFHNKYARQTAEIILPKPDKGGE